MSHPLISLNSDLQHLQNDGYDIGITAGHLLVRDVPYVNAARQVKRGTLVSVLDLEGDRTVKPRTHIAMFIGEHPCRADGTEIAQMKLASSTQDLGQGLIVQHSFSAKALGDGYRDHHHKMTTYVAIISGEARALDPTASAQTFTVLEATDDPVFKYVDTATSRAGIGGVNDKLRLGRVAIIGLGGTGSYVLDLVAKTPVREIHLFDGDRLSQHNAFRAPGAASIDELRMAPAKATYFATVYSKMRHNVLAFDNYVDASNIDQLRGTDFAFLCFDRGSAKKLIIQKLDEFGVPFVDAGMGVLLADDKLYGTLRVTASTPARREAGRRRIPCADHEGPNEYSTNIQIADLNALNATLAVIKWKKLFGFYRDDDAAHFSAYAIGGNELINEDRP
jgi:hypothetical protein